MRTSEIKLQLNNAAGGRLYSTRPHIPETEIKQNCRRSAETKPRPSAVFCFISVLFHHVQRRALKVIGQIYKFTFRASRTLIVVIIFFQMLYIIKGCRPNIPMVHFSLVINLYFTLGSSD